MPYDLKNVDGELDRAKVLAELDEILAIDTSSSGRLVSIERRITDLIDEAVEQAWNDGQASGYEDGRIVFS